MDKLFILALSITSVQLICALSSGSRNQLSKFIKHYEGLNYDRNDLKSKHQRVRRSLNPHEELHLNFHSHGRYFPLRLKRDISIFSEEFNIPEGDHTFHPANVYEGWIQGDQGSRVHGFLHDEIFEGKIRMSSGREFHIEPAWKYFNESKFHSVIYDVDNIHYPYPHGAGCGMRSELKDWMSKVQRSHIVKEEEVKRENTLPKDDDAARGPEALRVRRAAAAKTSCRLYVQADWKYVDLFAKSKDRSLYLMTQYVKSVADVYKETIFTGYQHRVELTISRMKAETKSDCQSTNCKFLDANIGVAKFLELNSETNHDDHCLAYVFTYRDFADGVLGLAWIGEKSGASGGVCERWKAYTGGKYKSLNTGVVTTLNYGSDVPLKVTEITLAHEIGHNFGSQHDPVSGSSCAPGASGGGNFIMYPKATSGSDTNNYKFSTCSRNYIGPVLVAKSDICFKEPSGPICGNRIVESGEECDCGYGSECDSDICCSSQSSASKCKYSPKAIGVSNSTRCSPSEGPCCNRATCTFKARDSIVCSNTTECALQAKCDGLSATCPLPPPKPDIVTDCQNKMKVCLNGTCTGSICLKTNQTDCMCNTKETYCDLCCMAGNDTSTCKSLDKNKKKAPGSPCDNYLGYCDIFSKCRKVDAEGPLSKLKNFIFNKETFNSIYTWMKDRWWACALIGLGLILFMAGFIKCCSVHTPSSNPNLPQARQMTLPRTISRRQRQRPAPSQNPRATAPPEIAPHEEPLPSYDTAVRQGHGRGRGRQNNAHQMKGKPY